MAGGEVQIADDRRTGVARLLAFDDQMLGALMRELAQYLLTDRWDSVEICCSGDDFAHLLLLVRGERRCPLFSRH
ncbi:hypothetical protein MNVI_10630 [Mycobacterium noviomagense]|uniref:Uncharacterized protein n=1 Tax=Mycobacterium noviomagense TaxID=459858 RepID=A0A7I7PB11_9MYCO|nr:hypothetical protein MNVI_10630 [Mycobacterium noviomagense]